MVAAFFRLSAGVLIAAFLIASPVARAQGVKALIDSMTGQAKPADRPAEPSLQEQLEWVRGEMAANRSLTEDSADKATRTALAEAGLPETRIEDFRTAAREIQRNLQGAADLLDGLKKLEEENASPVPQTPAPKTEAAAAGLRDNLRRAQLAAKSARGEADLLARLVAQQQLLTANAEKEIRQLGEEEASAQTGEARARAGVQLQLARLQKRAADAAVFFAKWRIYQQEILLKKADAQAGSIESALREGGFENQINAGRAASQLAALARESADLEKSLAAALKTQSAAIEDKKKLSAAGQSGPQAAARQSAADALVDAAQRLVAALQGTQSLLDLEKAHWLAVQSLANELDPATVRSAAAQSEDAIRTLSDWRPLLDRRALEARENLEAARRKLRETSGDPVLKDLLERTVETDQLRAGTGGAVISRIEQFVALQNDFLTELDAARRNENASRKLARTWDDIAAFAAGIWKFELFSAGDSSINVGKVILAIAGLLLALKLSGWISRRASRAAERNLRIAPVQRILLEKILFIPVAAILVLTTLNWLNIPLTVFAFFGGALAIGVGFGAQNLVNNFISGLILLLERQIKVGDIIEVGPSTGKITHLGSRCSRLRKFDGVEVLIPNSAFLEKEVVNWTLDDSHHRYDFTVGVAYGSPVDRALAVLDAAVRAQAGVLKDPEPGVYFESFGDSALIFRLYYWIEVGGNTDSRAVGSEIRCRIERELRAAGIELPFPQRDLRIRSASPIPVRIEKSDP